MSFPEAIEKTKQCLACRRVINLAELRFGAGVCLRDD